MEDVNDDESERKIKVVFSKPPGESLFRFRTCCVFEAYCTGERHRRGRSFQTPGENSLVQFVDFGVSKSFVGMQRACNIFCVFEGFP